MPTKKNTLDFIKAYKGVLNIKAPSSKSVSELNKAVDKAVEKVPKEIANKWKRMKLIEDKSLGEMAIFMKQLKKKQLKEGTLGKSAPVPKVARDKKEKNGTKTECRMRRRKDGSVYKKCYQK